MSDVGRSSAWMRRPLAPYAVDESQSGGRAHAEDEHPYRSCFQRDRDRIVHCSAFRRLDFKTQVFVPHEHDHFRTRLTHTLEVAQVARDLGRALGLNEDLVEAVALGHDLGHPPFGHAGEATLDALMGDHGGFEHNRQSLRVVDYLEHPYPSFRGLNLTRVVRECIAKHTTRYDHPACDEFADGLEAPLEGQLVDAADEIAYTSADLEDALAAGWIATQQLDELELWKLAWDAAERQFPGAGPIHVRIRAVKAVLAILADDLIETTREAIERSGPDSVQAVRRAGRKLVGFSDRIDRAKRQLQSFLLAEVYEHPQCKRKDREARRLIGELFCVYESDPAKLPDRYRRRIESDGLQRVICDYIAGMTDRFCRRTHEQLCGR